jgi:hypothetical protein
LAAKIDLDQFGFRCGSLRSQAAALYSQGATREYVTSQLGDPQLRVIAELEHKGFVIKKTRIRIGKSRPHIKYTILPKEG